MMRRPWLDTRIAEIEARLPSYETTRQHKARGLLIEELKQLRLERIRRDTRFRSRKRQAA